MVGSSTSKSRLNLICGKVPSSQGIFLIGLPFSSALCSQPSCVKIAEPAINCPLQYCSAPSSLPPPLFQSLLSCRHYGLQVFKSPGPAFTAVPAAAAAAGLAQIPSQINSKTSTSTASPFPLLLPPPVPLFHPPPRRPRGQHG